MEKILKFIDKGIKKGPIRRVIIFQDILFNNNSIVNENNIGLFTIKFEKEFKDTIINEIFSFEPDVIIWQIKNSILTKKNINNINQINYRFPGPFKFIVSNENYKDEFDCTNVDIFLFDFNNEIFEKIIKIEDLKKFS